MRRVLLGLALCALVSSAAIAAVTVPLFRGGYTDHEVGASPCGTVPTLQATPATVEGQFYLAYLCADSRVVMRRFAAYVLIPDRWERPAVVCPSGFVHTADKQGCVPPDHPAAGR